MLHTCHTGVVHRASCILCVHHKIPNIFKISDLHLVRMFVNFMFLDSSSKLLVAPPNIVVITLRLTDTVFSHFVLIL